MKRPFFSRKTSKHEQSNASSPQPLKDNFGRMKRAWLTATTRICITLARSMSGYVEVQS